MHEGAEQPLCCGCLTEVTESTPTLPQQRVLTPVFLMLPTLAAVVVRLRAGHALTLRTGAHVTARLMAIAVLEVLREYVLSPSG